MAACCRESIKYLRGCVYDGVAAPSIPAIEEGCSYWERVGDLETLTWVRGRVLKIPEIANDWIDRIDEAIAFVKETRTLRSSMETFFKKYPTFPDSPEAIRLAADIQGAVDRLMSVLQTHPGLPQNELRGHIGVPLREIEPLLKCLEREGFLQRQCDGRTKRLYLKN